MASPLARAQSVSMRMGSSRVRPSAVSEYSTRGGASAKTRRSIKPFDCRRRRVCVRTLREIPPMRMTSSP